MTEDRVALYTAYAARDARFDGLFFIGVTSTGIYCRPICPAKTPRLANCRFFRNAAEAEKAAFRPCLRCRPELAPGNAPVDDSRRIVGLLVRRIEDGLLDDEAGVAELADLFGLSTRQIRRIVNQELGVAPKDLIQTRRLLLAKQLLTETTLPIIEVAFASGFSSVRRFNDAFSRRYGMPPRRLRKAAHKTDTNATGESLTLQLAYRPPYDWHALIHFIGARTLSEVEAVHEGVYYRTVRIANHTGWVRVRHAPEKRALLVEFAHSLAPVLPPLLGALRSLFDVNARPDLIAAHLMRDAILAESVARHPGLRVPGAFNGFEHAVRAILGQQVTVKAATTLARRFAERFGDPIATPYPFLTRLSPTPQRIAAASIDDIASLGIIQSRTRAIIALATEVASGRIQLDASAPPAQTYDQLVALPGIGPWTAHYIALRALRSPDAFPKEDIVLRKVLGGVSAARAEELSQAWRPWRSYATMHLWLAAAGGW